jgi:hypothetical protein
MKISSLVSCITFHIDTLQYLVILIGYVLTITTSGLIVRHFIGHPPQETSNTNSEKPNSKNNYDLGVIVGKCENFLVITLILADALTGLALIFTAKSIMRSERFKKDPKYYLGGTIVNFTYSFIMGFSIRILLNAVGHPVS